MVETIIIGNDISSLIAALSCCRKGMQTLLIHDSKRSIVFSESGYTFNVDPLPWSGLGDSDLCLHPFLEEMLHEPLKQLFVSLNPALQVILPQHRLDIYRDRDLMIKETKREFSENRVILESFYESVVRTSQAMIRLAAEFPSFRPRGIRTSGRFIKLLSSFLRERSLFLRKWSTLQDDSLLRFFEAQMAFLSGYCDDGMEKAASAPFALSLPLQGLFYPLGGKHILANALKDDIRSHGGTIIEGCHITGVTLGPQRCHVEWRSGDEIFDCSAKRLILSAGWKNLHAFFSGHKRLKALSNRLKRTERALHSFTLHMGILDKGLPEKMAEYVILATPMEKSLRDPGLIFLELSIRGDTGRAPDGKRALSATIFLDEAPSALSDERLREISSQLLQNLESFLPFLNENLDYFSLEKCLEVSRTLEDMTSRKYLLIRNPLNPFSRVSNKTPLKNVFLTGGSLLSGFGFAGEVLSGMNAANLVSGGHAH